jgi:hypothetical protein
MRSIQSDRMMVWKVGLLLAAFATILDNSEASTSHRGTAAQSTQAKIDALDKQFWGEGTGVDQRRVKQAGPGEDVMNDIEEEALQKAGFTMQQQQQQRENLPESGPSPESDYTEMEEVDTDVPTSSAMAGKLEEQLETTTEALTKMKVRAKEAGREAEHEKTMRHALQEGVGARMREQEQFYSYMSHWWRDHRDWMKRHNRRLYQTLRQHRALSLSTVWKPFLLRWHYVQPRLLQGYRYNWNDDGTYAPKRYLMKSKRRQGGEIVAARIRSVNNICFPGLLSPQRKHEMCNYERPVSARAVQFLMERGQFQSPSLTVMRAYTSFIPKSEVEDTQLATGQWQKAKPPVTFVSVQGLHWQLMEVIEYCDTPTSATGVSVPVPFSPKSSSPVREYSFKFMEWYPIKMGRQLLDTGATVENVELKTMDEKIRISCVVPVDHPQNIDGEEVTLTQQKCSIYMRQWTFNLKCPDGKSGAIALKTKVTSRDDGGSGDGKPTMTPDFKDQLTFDKNKVSMQFQKQAVLHIRDKDAGTDRRSSVPVVMGQSSQTEWTPDPRFKSSKDVYFSFIMADVRKLSEGILNWDPKAIGNFHDQVHTLKTTRATPTNAAKQSTAAAAAAGTQSTQMDEILLDTSMLERKEEKGTSFFCLWGMLC